MAKASLEVAQGTRQQNEKIMEMLETQREDNHKMSSYLEAKIPEMGKKIPLPDMATLNRFVDDSDGVYALRRAELYSFLYSCRTSKKKLFGTSLMKTLFSENFLRNYSWPANNSRISDDPDVVPAEFVALIKSTLARTAGAGLLDPDIVDLEFWNNWPKKYREAKRYVHEQDEKKKKKAVADLKKTTTKKVFASTKKSKCPKAKEAATADVAPSSADASASSSKTRPSAAAAATSVGAKTCPAASSSGRAKTCPAAAPTTTAVASSSSSGGPKTRPAAAAPSSSGTAKS